jgi:hypothetical protein
MATVVTAYYRLPKSKHSYEKYREWITNFLRNVKGPIHMFTSATESEWIREVRAGSGLENFTLEILPFSEVPFQTPEWMDYWLETMETQDEFKHLHSPEQFAIWNSKTWFVMRAIRANAFKTDKFVWCDTGCWRDGWIAGACGSSWPVADKIPEGRMLFLDIRDISWQRESIRAGKLWQQINTRNAKEFCIGGTIFAGSKSAWNAWNNCYYDTLAKYKENGWFAGDDQSVMMSTDLRIHENVPVHILAPQTDNYFYGHGDRWFALQILLSDHVNAKLH